MSIVSEAQSCINEYKPTIFFYQQTMGDAGHAEMKRHAVQMVNACHLPTKSAS